MKRFIEAVEENMGRLKQYVPIVDKVHGGSHPEFHDVRKVFDEIYGKINNGESEKANLDNEFKELRKITDNYTVPGDVCESYEAVYKMLEEVELEYNS